MARSLVFSSLLSLLALLAVPVLDARADTLRVPSQYPTIQEAIDALPWEYRELILLRHFGELPYEEIAQLKGMPLGTVKNKLFRGRQMLKDKLQGFLED